jgi:hypothetical protein
VSDEVQLPDGGAPLTEGASRTFRLPVKTSDARTFAELTGDDWRACDRSGSAPVGFPLVVAAQSLQSGIGKLPRSIDLASLRHAEQSLTILAPIPLDSDISVTVTLGGWIRYGSGEAFECELVMCDATESREFAILKSIVFARTTDELKPDGRHVRTVLPRAGQLCGQHTIDVSPDLPLAYARLTGDYNPIHTDVNAARAVGYSGIVLHGFCTMALTTAVVTRHLCEGDSSRLHHIQMRFAEPVSTPASLTYEIFDTDRPGVYRLHGVSAEKSVIKQSIVELVQA